MTKQNLLVTVSTLALLATMATASIAQAPSGSGAAGATGAGSAPQQQNKPGEANRDGGGKERGAGEQQKGEQPKGQQQQKSEQPKGQKQQSSEDRSSPKSRAQAQDGSPKAADRADDKASPKGVAQGQKKDSNEDRRSPAADNAGKGTTKQSETDQTKTRDRAADGATKGEAGDRDRIGRADVDRKGQDKAEGGRTQGAGERVELTEQKRSSVRDRMEKSARANRVTNVDFDIRVGVNVPRNTTFHMLPPDVVEIVPAYRGYRYVYVRDEIVIIHPTNYTVVAVIGGGGGTQASSRTGDRITLTANDRIFVRQNVDMDARVRLGIASFSIGMDLPEGVELRALPERVSQRYPTLRGHRYFVSETDVVIVEPQARRVVLIIED